MRQRDAAMLHAERGPKFSTVWLQDGLLVLQLLNGNASSSSNCSEQDLPARIHRTPVSRGLLVHTCVCVCSFVCVCLCV